MKGAETSHATIVDILPNNFPVEQKTLTMQKRYLTKIGR